MHNLHGYADPTNSTIVRNLLDTSKRVGYKPVNKKDAITVNIIKKLFAKYSDSTDLFIVRDLAMIILCFCGFLRYDEMSNIRCKDLCFVEDSHLKIHIVKSKTDQYRQGHDVLLSKLENGTCPLQCLKLYVKLAKIDLNNSDYLFKALYKTRNGVGLRHMNKRLSYTRTKEVICARVKEFAPRGFKFGLHSLRAGGASAAANAKVNDRCWRRHGRWKSDAAHGYIEDSISNKLSVSQNLGL
jgi:integrase